MVWLMMMMKKKKKKKGKIMVMIVSFIIIIINNFFDDIQRYSIVPTYLLHTQKPASLRTRDALSTHFP